MYDGYLTFDGTEVINMERLMAYVNAGIRPLGVDVRDCTGTCEGLGEAVGDGTYRSPMLDQPPWFDPDNPDTVDFAGVLPLEITGMDGSVRTVEMTPMLGRGAIPMRPAYGQRTIAVSAFLVGRTSAGVEQGLAWLTTVLHRTCRPTDTCDASEVVAFTSCPTPICPGGTGAQDEPMTGTNQPYSPDTWMTSGGHTTDADTFVSDAPPRWTNYLPNPSAEQNVVGWHADPNNTAWGTATVTQSTTQRWVGTRSALLSFTALAGQPSAQSQTVSGLVVGRWYSFEVRLFATAAGTFAVQPYVATAAGVNVLGEPTTVTGQWVRRVVSFQASATTAQVGVRTVGSNVAATCFVDGGIVTDFNGGAIQRSDFEAGVTPWKPTTLQGFMAAGALASSTEQHVTGLASLRVTWGPVATGQWDDTDASVTWDTVQPTNLTWNNWPTDTA